MEDIVFCTACFNVIRGGFVCLLDYQDVDNITRKADKDGDGQLDFYEFVQVAAPLIAEWSETFQPTTVCKQDDNQRTVDQWASWWGNGLRREDTGKSKSNGEKNDYVAAAFRAFDSDNNGRTSRAELRAALRFASIDSSEDRVTEFFSAFDKDGDGEISYEEFSILLRELRSLQVKDEDNRLHQYAWRRNCRELAGTS